jgi:iron complex transport system permease protein
LIAVLLIGIIIGSVNINILNILNQQNTDHTIIWDIRVPRILMAAIAGAALGITGAAYQALFDNPLADSYILGISSGAALGAVIALSLGFGFIVSPLFGFIFAILTGIAAYLLGRKRGKLDNTKLILAGIIINTILSAFIMLIISLSPDKSVQNIIFWLMGNLQNVAYTEVSVAAICGIIGIAMLYSQSKYLNVMILGDEHAIPLGIDTNKVRIIILLSTSLILAATVSFIGMIGFVGLIVPHMVKLLFGYDNRLVMLLSALGGGIFLVLCDIISRSIIAPSELPIGVITALIGAPLFLYLLKRKV